MIKFSVITPVYNCSVETHEYLISLTHQTYKDFEVIIVEDGEQDSSQKVVASFQDRLKIQYYHKKNTPVSYRRNFGMSVAKGDFFVFFDSDCIIPKDYFQKVIENLTETSADVWGGPDEAHTSFSTLQKAINYSMTSFFTTGGIRGSKKNMDKFYPRSFNMGVSKQVFEETGGFPLIINPGEDIIFSILIRNKKFKVALFNNAFVYHKRKFSIKKFYQQIYRFAFIRFPISETYPETFKLFYLFPTLYILGTLTLIVLSLIYHPLFIFPVLFYWLLLFVESLLKNKNLNVALLSIITTVVQFSAYALGFSFSAIMRFLLGKKKYYKFVSLVPLLTFKKNN